MTIAIVSALDDLSALASLHAACFEDPWCESALRNLLKSPRTAAFAASDGFIIVRVAGDEAEILTLAIAATARRKGLGTTLMIEAARYASGRGARTMFLEVATSNDAAHALYARLGFHEVGRRKSYYAPGEDALILRTELPLIPLGNTTASTSL
ncbi:MAG: ribosomal protein S18-alanine N-acetyltransferase [Rhizomicrobium sp.]